MENDHNPKPNCPEKSRVRYSPIWCQSVFIFMTSHQVLLYQLGGVRIPLSDLTTRHFRFCLRCVNTTSRISVILNELRPLREIGQNSFPEIHHPQSNRMTGLSYAILLGFIFVLRWRFVVNTFHRGGYRPIVILWHLVPSILPGKLTSSEYIT